MVAVETHAPLLTRTGADQTRGHAVSDGGGGWEGMCESRVLGLAAPATGAVTVESERRLSACQWRCALGDGC